MKLIDTDRLANHLSMTLCKRPVFLEEQHLLKVLKQYKNVNFLDAGCGLCIWADFVHKSRPDIKISCLDINKDLVKKASKKGYDAKVGSILKMPYKDNSFDVVHCSHVIEHFGYPNVLKLLNELFRIVKPGGIVIIKSLLDGGTFWNDIDHVRPYYPETIVNYLNLEQQQSTTDVKMSEVYRWYVQYPPIYRKQSFYRTIGEVLRLIFWKLLKKPTSTRIHYGIVFRKEA